jgi:hypothetical protein
MQSFNPICRPSEFQFAPSIQQQSSVGSGMSDESLPKASSASTEKLTIPMDASNPQINLVINKNDSIEEEVEPPEKAMKQSIESIAEVSESKSVEIEIAKTDDKVRKISSGSIGQKTLKTCTCSKSKKEPVEQIQVSETSAIRPTTLLKSEDVVKLTAVSPSGPNDKPDKETRKSFTISPKQSIEKEKESRDSSLEDAGQMQEDEHYKELTQQQISQDDEFDMTMSTGLLPGRVVSLLN